MTMNSAGSRGRANLDAVSELLWTWIGHGVSWPRAHGKALQLVARRDENPESYLETCLPELSWANPAVERTGRPSMTCCAVEPPATACCSR